MRTISASTAGLWKSAHPGPTLVVTALSGVLAVGAGVDLWRGLLLVAAVFFGQLSVGLSNDAIDAERDRAVQRKDKPIARGDISVSAAWVGAGGSLLLALLLSAPLGWVLLIAHAAALVSAWSYNLGLKATVVSVVPYMVTFGLFPSLSTLAHDSGQWASGWAWVAGAALGVALHMTNVLPDLDDDAQTGIRGLPHRLGGTAAAAVASVTLVFGAAAVAAGPVQWQISDIPAISWLLCGVVVLLASVTVLLSLTGRPGRVQFQVVMLAALMLAVQLVISGGSLVH
ncbi:UbiA family prenyltransferase [Nesterenkonia massiliensis]|uniref:UbiA family prenyltransferase n=1 Tax=Nesterenkonia massiliensis TaxID=1232429 RepID=A0ABT2HQM8_9MICC|nr:UbiA family prenyltransferase [Nesterenkonia massiliensis]MCT1607000.1 UbiA family prenyltransferase [Nesterenkonia massiliensis]